MLSIYLVPHLIFLTLILGTSMITKLITLDYCRRRGLTLMHTIPLQYIFYV
jgi:hypothetical protein